MLGSRKLGAGCGMANRWDEGAREDWRDDRDRPNWLFVLVLLLLLAAAVFFGLRWWTAGAERASQDAAAQPVDTSLSDVVPAPLPEFSSELGQEPVPEPALVAEPEPIDEPAAPVETAAPPPPRAPEQYTVYFELMKASLTPEAAQSISARLADIDPAAIAGIAVDGYTDTAGRPDYNAPLSVRRADAVRDYLARNGAPVALIDADGHGENALAVETADGVREALNRRAVITIRFK